MCEVNFQIMIANSKSEGSKKTPKDEEKLQRLFIMVPKSFTDSDLREEFEVMLLLLLTGMLMLNTLVMVYTLHGVTWSNRHVRLLKSCVCCK